MKIDINFYIAQHEVYKKRLKLAVENKQAFNHKECCRDVKENCCAFGQVFYRDIMPNIDQFPEEVKRVILEIEDYHCQFHELAKKVDILNPDEELLKEVEKASFELYKLLLRLEKMLKS
ncbi:MAG: CZB domain-containing protein [Aquificaceae bacterium]|nr:CZB domain-containing protein [Aquificaceae bacterium]